MDREIKQRGGMGEGGMEKAALRGRELDRVKGEGIECGK